MDPADRRPGRALGIITVLMTLLGWSSVPLFIKHFADLIDPWTSNGCRYGFSALLWAPVLVWGASRGGLPKGLWRAALVPAIFNSLGQISFTWAHYKIDPALLTFGLRVQIVFVAIGAAVLFVPERRIIRTTGFLAGLVLVFCGTMGTVVLDPGFGRQATTLGVALAVGSGLCFACYGLSVRYFMHGVNPLQAFAAISQYTAAVMVALMLTRGDRAGLTALDLPAAQFGLLLLSAVIGIALGHVFYYISIARLGVAVTSGVVQLQPVLVGAATPFFLAGPALTTAQWCTGAVAILGAATILWTQHRLAAKGPDAADDRAEFAALPPDHVAAAACAEADPADAPPSRAKV